MMKKWQLALVIVLLLGVVLGMNTLADWRAQKAKKYAEEVKKAREQAELAAKAIKGVVESQKGPHAGPPAFKLPPNSGPKNAPVKLEVLVNDANSCHHANLQLKDLQQIYGPLVRIEWYSMTDPKVAARSDKLGVGCEAGLLINGKIEMEIEKYGGKVLQSFRGPLNDKFQLVDVYRAVNAELRRKGKKPPRAALAKASSP